MGKLSLGESFIRYLELITPLVDMLVWKQKCRIVEEWYFTFLNQEYNCTVHEDVKTGMYGMI